MKHLKVLASFLFTFAAMGVLQVSEAQSWSQGSYVVQSSTIITSGQGTASWAAGGTAHVFADVNAANSGTAYIAITFRVTWTWSGTGPSSSLTYHPSAVLSGSQAVHPKGYASSGVDWHANDAQANTDDDGTPYAFGVLGGGVTEPGGAFSFYDDILASAYADQAGLAMPICAPGCPGGGAGGAHGDSQVSF